MFRSLADFIQRVFWVGGSARPVTEAFQRAIMAGVSMGDTVSLREIAARSFPMVETEVREYGIAEAAQILVNRGAVIAERAGIQVDPVTAGLDGVSVRLAGSKE